MRDNKLRAFKLADEVTIPYELIAYSLNNLKFKV